MNLNWKALSVVLIAVSVTTSTISMAMQQLQVSSIALLPSALAAVLAEPNTVNSAAIIDGTITGKDIMTSVALNGTLRVNSKDNAVGVLNGNQHGHLYINAPAPNGAASVILREEGAPTWALQSYQKDLGNQDFKIGNEQTKTVALGIDGATNQVSLSNDLKCNGCIDKMDLKAKPVITTVVRPFTFVVKETFYADGYPTGRTSAMTVKCQPGETVTGGGFSNSNDSIELIHDDPTGTKKHAVPRIVVLDSKPIWVSSANPIIDSWYVRVQNTGPENKATVFVVCAKVTMQ